MTRTSTHRLALLLAASLAMLFVALALTSARASAAKTPFCLGQTINQNQTCFGASRNFEWILGRGTKTGVCVGYNAVAAVACSSTAGELAAASLGSYAVRTPRIVGISPNNTTVENAETF
jgi:hypothetical protein